MTVTPSSGQCLIEWNYFVGAVNWLAVSKLDTHRHTVFCLRAHRAGSEVSILVKRLLSDLKIDEEIVNTFRKMADVIVGTLFVADVLMIEETQVLQIV